ncbi:hypothetical protein PGSY75_0023700 [Plasmodium gaboni]|uniref:Uncharacterized protein n=1 Tax=Plasmodium gaboni TaxID=647221 RepID=A0A151L2S7_9APIC|nr:hypothetical protein PGSY75_0023700 [Plasmodium gaboni]XP_028540613.1 conserved Plasmodium protein, unknown function [Plasmodium sp. gorilla clade G2]SOV25000.1 conserved Plasmodium protein, unknown function [Plasmodium sp. DRC-Itaito]SOV82711.1 conserved Plasmodium protein, unknown function [Plasmodium sp. gorilla clade G3]KYN93263.1 hypothetical protein PGSY75_0023700 [Plasmodium gaboni]SOV18983.1 conserved Plasmodium protein, unknown function [Plasmodium gaboni]SOV19035.1 conserved Plas
MNDDYASKPPTYIWDINIGLNALSENILDSILFFGFIISILGSFYFLYWLQSGEMRNMCNKSS